MARRSILLACEQLELLIGLSRSELPGFFVPASCLGEIWHHAVDAQFLQNCRVVGFGQHHGRARIATISRTPQHEASRSKIATRNQGRSATERRGDLAGIEMVNGSWRDHALCDRRGLWNGALQRALIGTLDVIARWRRSGHRNAPNAKRRRLRRRRPWSLG